MSQQIYFVGTPEEVAHHHAPLDGRMAYQIVDAADVTQLARAGDLAIFFSEHFDRFRSAIANLKTKNVGTLYLIDGILEWRNAWENRSDEPACPFTMRPVLADKAACIGNAQARILCGWGNFEKVEVVGIPRLDSLTRQKRYLNTRSDSQSSNSSPARLLVMTAKFPSYTPEQRQQLIGSLKDLQSHLQGRTEVSVTWRLTAGLDKEIGVENQLGSLSGKELATVLEQTDAVISTPSTAILESMLLGVPTATIDYTNSPAYLNTAWRISAADQIASEVSALLAPSEERLQFQRSLLADALQLGEPATQRLENLISEMLRLQSEPQVTSSDSAIARPLLTPPAAEFAHGFDHSAMFSSFAEFQSDDKVQLQAELAHARREILHLQRQLKQIETELGQAHQIFDEINNHPVAGRIVKIRQRLLTLFKKYKPSNIQPES